jgi:hypothetical protein
MIFVQQCCISGRNKISKIGDKTKDEITVLMVQLRDQRIAGKDHESEAVHDSTRDLTGSHCLYVYFEGRSGSPRRPLFAYLRSAFAFFLSTSLTVGHVAPSSGMGPSPRHGSCSALCVKKPERILADGRNCEKYCGKNRGWLSSSQRRTPEIL